MNNKEQLYQIAFSLIRGVGPKKGSSLLATLEDPERVFKESPKLLSSLTGFSADFFRSLNLIAPLEKAEKELGFILKNDIQMHFYSNENYPRRLRQCADGPLMIYSRGDFDPNAEKVLAVVGTRNCTSYGERIIKNIMRDLSGQGIQIISGLAYGIDILAHRNALQQNITTIGVMGNSLDRIYPFSHRSDAKEMMKNGGLISEFISGTKPDRENFPMRNRIVAGMSDAVVVIESKISGGSLITADLALDYNRDVFAFPGSIEAETSVGCNDLIKKNKAQLISSAEEILKWMGWNSQTQMKQTMVYQDVSHEEAEILYALQNGELHIDLLSAQTSRSIRELNPILFNLELKGLVRSLPGTKFSCQ